MNCDTPESILGFLEIHTEGTPFALCAVLRALSQHPQPEAAIDQLLLPARAALIAVQIGDL